MCVCIVYCVWQHYPFDWREREREKVVFYVFFVGLLDPEFMCVNENG